MKKILKDSTSDKKLLVKVFNTLSKNPSDSNSLDPITLIGDSHSWFLSKFISHEERISVNYVDKLKADIDSHEFDFLNDSINPKSIVVLCIGTNDISKAKEPVNDLFDKLRYCIDNIKRHCKTLIVMPPPQE